jgi:hypothetical protein
MVRRHAGARKVKLVLSASPAARKARIAQSGNVIAQNDSPLAISSPVFRKCSDAREGAQKTFYEVI